MDRFEMMEALGDLPEQYYAKSLPQTGASERKEVPFRMPRLVTAGALAACMLFAVGVSAVLLHGRLAERALSSAEDSEENERDSAYDSETEFAVQTSVSERMTAGGNTPYSTDTEPNTAPPALYALPEYENLSDRKTWETTALEEPGIYYNGAEIPAKMSVIARTDPAGQPAPAGNPGPQLRIGKPHTEMYAVGFDFYVPEGGQICFVPYDESNTVYADDRLGDEQFWFRITQTGTLERQSTFGKHYEKLRDRDGVILQVPDYQCGVWHHCYLKTARASRNAEGEIIENAEFVLQINNMHLSMIDLLGTELSGYLALDGTPGVMFANFAFYDSTETAPVTLTPNTPPPETAPDQTKKTEKTVTLASDPTLSAGETVTSAVTAAKPAVSPYEEQRNTVLDRITDRPCDEVIRVQTPASALHGFYNFREGALRNYACTVVSFDQTAGIELLRKTDDHHMYAINRISRENNCPGGLFYSFFEDDVLMNTAWMSRALEKSDFDDIHIGDPIAKVAAVEPVTKEFEGVMDISSSREPHTEGHDQTLLLKDGVLVIHYCIPVNTEQLDWRITDMQFYPDFKVPESEWYQGREYTTVYDYSILPEDLPA